MNKPPLTGLTPAEVEKSRARFGENRLPAEKGVSAWTILLNQLKSPLIYIILVAAGVSLALGELGDFAIIAAVIVVDVIMGFVQEYQAQRSYVALKSLLKPTTTVIRGGEHVEIEVWELVPGDLVILSSGEKVPGDGELTEATKLSVDEAILTGESEPVGKDIDTQSQVSMGTTIVTGWGILKVTGTGARTELGKIAVSLSTQKEEDTPLQLRLKSFSKTLTYIVVAFTIAILLIGMLMGHEFFDMLRVSIVLAIAAVPEGLLIAVTVILVIGMRRILKRNGLVKKLLAVETLGSVTVICTDKTGTLTEGRMRVNQTDLTDQKRAWQTIILCNNLEGPMDIALWGYAEKQDLGSPQELFDSTERLDEELFSSETKYMIVAVTGGEFQTDHYYFLKGAPEIVLGMCDMSDRERERHLAKVDEWAGTGARLLGLAYRQSGSMGNRGGYTWLGLLGMEDPIRAGVIESIRVARRAGIKIKMITGDYLRTAEVVARNIGLMDDGDHIIEGLEIAKLTDGQLRERMKETVVFSRVRPQDKFRIIQALQANGEITAMIGDGVNDAPALKHAHIGVVVGSATDVAKETADLILLDNNFRTIVAAIEEGRVIFANIRKVVAYTLSNSFSEMLVIFFAMVLHWPVPLVVAQILWIHLICDGPSDIVLGFEPKEEGIMKEKPMPLRAPVLTRLSLILIGVISASSAIFVLLIFGALIQQHGLAEGRSIVFASFAINSMVYIFAYRSLRRPLFRISKLGSNKYLLWVVLAGILTALVAFWIPALRNLLGLVPLSLMDWGWVWGIAFLLLVFVEVGKLFANNFYRK
jgi:Ca2+-transporting ATPase